MYQRLSAVLFPVAALLLVGSAYWGYQEHQEKNSILIKAENQYQRAFHDLTYHVDKLHEELGNTLAVNSTSQAYHRKGLINVWRITNEAQNEINQLPLTLLPFTRTEEFLSKIANFSYKTAIRDLTKEPLTQKEYDMLLTLYKNSEDIATNLQGMQTKVLQENLRWMDVELALASSEEQEGNTLVDGFRTVDKKVSEYPELDWGPSVTRMYEKRTLKLLQGETKSAEDIRQSASHFLGIKDASVIQVEENGQGTEYQTYSAVVSDPNSDRQIKMDFTKNGGRMIWYLNPRDVDSPAVDVGTAEQAASSFLRTHGYPNMQAISFDRTDNAIVLTFAALQDEVLIYPEKLTVKVALDNGDIIGLQAADFVYAHHERTISKPSLDSKEARKALNPALRLKSERLALIENDMGEETLCYEFTGNINGGSYRIYINADTGQEEKIERFESME
ncbi:germination protein YpeB [Paenibacillus tarimensis]|uniref:germination protein YpeB n=1 Tax=Paenibacillus tarimensis TaxID=416012 RepID=UPI001F203E95|nr:germination protein YpeB [Paenibacillus tarimensis]MCF2942517.1 germination protein YpeB [Paenibacillus tarimensis]